MIFFYSFLIFTLGACLGSFANVCIYRLPKNKQIISGRSFCPKCKKKIIWYDNLPLISFLFLSGKCRKCNKVISPRYFIVELITGFIFLLIYLTSDNLSSIIFLSILSLISPVIYRFSNLHWIECIKYEFPLEKRLPRVRQSININYKSNAYI